jgi:uncharacterized protein YuzE
MKSLLFVLCVMLATPLSAAEWTGYLMDTMCAASRLDKAASHTTECMKSCKQSGFGLVTKDGKYIKFNEAGNIKALNALELTGKQDELLVKVTGDMNGNVIRVESVAAVETP